jgi:hypothetical protein
MDAQGIPAEARDVAIIKRVFGEPIERDGATVIPVAAVWCFGLVVRPIGVYHLKDGAVEWQPALDTTRIAIGGQIVGIVALLVLRDLLRRRGRRGQFRQVRRHHGREHRHHAHGSHKARIEYA